MPISTRPYSIGAGCAVVASLLGSCKAPEAISGGIGAPQRLLVAVDVAPDTVRLTPGGTADFTASFRYDDGTVLTDQRPTYRANQGVINASGRFTAGTDLGAFFVTGSAGGVTDTSTILIEAEQASIVGLRVTPASAALVPGATQDFTVLGVLSDGGTTAVTADVIATGGSLSGSGRYTAGQVTGSFIVVASLKGGAPADTAEVTITQPLPTLQSVVLTPASATLDQGAQQQFTATGLLTDGSTTPIPVTWTATGGQVNSSGRYTAGTTSGSNFRVIARSADGKADTSGVIIRTPSISSVTVTPDLVALQTGQTQQFTATARLSNGSTQNNPAVSWSATGGSINGSGVYTPGLLPGTYQVIATANGKADTSTVTLTLANIVGLLVSPGTTNVVQGQTRDFTVSGLLSNGGTILAPVVSWSATGGSISASGQYTAGATAGNYRAIATLTGGAVADTADVAVVEQGANLYPNRPVNYANVLSDLDMSQAVPAGGGNERFVAGTNNVWSVIYDSDDNGGSNWTRITDATAPQSPSSVWQLRWPAGSWTDGHGSGNIGRPLNNVNEIYISYWVKWDPLFEFHPISSKHIRLQKDDGNFLLQASHDNFFLRASDEGIGQAYEPQITSKPTLGVWHHIEMVVKAGSPGTVKVWMDGQIRTNYTNLRVSGPFNAFSIDGHLGGGGMTKVRDSYTWYDHIFIATP